MVVFRLEGESLQLIHGPEEATHFTTPSLVIVDWPVQRGDLVGVLMPDSCINESGVREGEFRIGCPSHIDLRADPWSFTTPLIEMWNLTVKSWRLYQLTGFRRCRFT